MNVQMVSDDKVSMLRIAREENHSCHPIPMDVATGVAVRPVLDLPDNLDADQEPQPVMDVNPNENPTGTLDLVKLDCPLCIDRQCQATNNNYLALKLSSK